ncbi:MAG: endolytic transglycosylase MltG [Deltaproteobacteria bacterium]|nr:endolytic transglycosylase MltG [Deltaproteobacteria bacterium]MBW2136634.1 endolytic transglycosylase MltG [Deltaproteobacteria bacterium]
MSRKRVLTILVGVVFLVFIFLSLGVGLFMISPAGREGRDQVIVIKEGQTLREVAHELEEKAIISSKTLFLLWAKIMGYGRQIKSGEYALNSAMPPVRIFEKLTKGMILTHPVTIPEGFTREQIARLLAVKGLVEEDRFLGLTNAPSLLERLGIPGPTMEGYLYPDTYHFGRGISELSIIETMVKRFWQLVGPLKRRTEEAGMTLKDVITLASIVEKETGLGQERPIIASVFLNRLKKGMRLESDPTVIYGIENFNGNLTRKDLARRTPYNTYVVKGLPPGPIANPGLESIMAVLYPADTDYLYFVSRNDGSHHFSKTLAGHNRAVRLYQKKRKAQQ